MAIFGREAVKGDYSKLQSFPMLDWNDEDIQKYFTLFNPIEIKNNCTEEDMSKAINKRFEEIALSRNCGIRAIPSINWKNDVVRPLCRSEERRVGKECRSRWSPYH